MDAIVFEFVAQTEDGYARTIKVRIDVEGRDLPDLESEAFITADRSLRDGEELYPEGHTLVCGD